MLILVHATNLRSAGGLAIALNFIHNIKEGFPDVRLHVLAPAGSGYEKYHGDNIHIEIAPAAAVSPLRRLFTDKRWMQQRIQAVNPDLLFTLGNFAIPTDRLQAVQFMYPYAIYPDDRDVWQRFPLLQRIDVRLRNVFFKQRIHHAHIVFAQTATAERRLLQYYPFIRKIKVVPTAYSSIRPADSENKFDRIVRKDGLRYLLCLTRYYTHKNVEIFIPLAQRFKSEGSPYRIIVTFEKEQHVKAAAFLEEVERLGLDDIIINLGTVPMSDVFSLYGKVDALLLPTLLESFSGTYADSMFLKKPIITSDRDFAIDVCKDAAWYFDPLNVDSIAQCIHDAFSDPDEMERRTELGHAYSAAMPDWPQVTQMYVDALKQLATTGN